MSAGPEGPGEWILAPIYEPTYDTFEGQKVDHTRVRLSSTTKLDVEGCYRIDQVVRLCITGHITRVDHVVDEVTGHLVRIHTVKVDDATPITDTTAGVTPERRP